MRDVLSPRLMGLQKKYHAELRVELEEVPDEFSPWIIQGDLVVTHRDDSEARYLIGIPRHTPVEQIEVKLFEVICGVLREEFW